MSGSFQLNDDASGLVGTLSGEDKGGNPEPLPAGSTANWTLNDPDGTITMTISTDTLSVQLVPTGKITATQRRPVGGFGEHSGATTAIDWVGGDSRQCRRFGKRFDCVGTDCACVACNFVYKPLNRTIRSLWTN